jgi:hypothetical protein
MKTIEQAIAEVRETILNIRKRPGMYVGLPPHHPGATDAINDVLWISHWFWTFMQSREDDFRNKFHELCILRGRGEITFVTCFRQDHPEADEAAVYQYTLDCWAEIGEMLGLEQSRPPS